MIYKWFTGDSENDLKINIFLAAVESAVDVDVDADLDADADVVFKDPALIHLGTVQKATLKPSSSPFFHFKNVDFLVFQHDIFT